MLFTLIRTQYKGVFSSCKNYWKAYGGVLCIISSPFFHLAFLLTLFLFITKSEPYTDTFIFHISLDGNGEWTKICLNTIPNVLGFSLGGYAMFLGFSDTKFLETVKGDFEDGEPSPYIKLNAAFVHFIVTQCVTIILAITLQTLKIRSIYTDFIGTLLLFYSITTLLAATFAILRFAGIYDKYSPEEDKDDEKDKNDNKK